MSTKPGEAQSDCVETVYARRIRTDYNSVQAWRIAYNTARPHSALTDRTPAEFANTLTDMTCSRPNPTDRYE